jgi:hypothetical protein
VRVRVRVRVRMRVQLALVKASVQHVQSRSASPSFYSPVLARLWLYSPHALSSPRGVDCHMDTCV